MISIIKLKSLFLFFFCLVILVPIYAQKKTISGQIYYVDGSPVEFAISTLSVNDSIFQAAQTDSLGNYKLTVDNKVFNYKLACSVLGKIIHEEEISFSENSILSHNIQLTKNVKDFELDEIIIKGSQKSFVKTNDKYIFTPDPNLLVSSTAFDALKHIPTVKISNDEISLLSKSGTKIYINGKPSQMPTNSMIEYLQSLPSDNIKNIEIITNPGSKYEASAIGGIINIV